MSKRCMFFFAVRAVRCDSRTARYGAQRKIALRLLQVLRHIK